jgi:hypothetical protein
MRTTADVDVDVALALVPRVRPDFVWHADALRAAADSAAVDDVSDGALRAALARGRVDLARNTFLYLRWKLETERPPGDAADARGGGER